MRNLLIIILSLFFSSSLFAQYTLKSPHLQNPAKAIGYVDSCAQFWLNTYDPVYGGFYTNIDKFGNVIYNQNKHMLTQSRNVYGMVRAYMLTADTSYLDYARDALNFMYQHAWDVTSGGWLQELDEQGVTRFLPRVIKPVSTSIMHCWASQPIMNVRGIL